MVWYHDVLAVSVCPEPEPKHGDETKRQTFARCLSIIKASPHNKNYLQNDKLSRALEGMICKSGQSNAAFMHTIQSMGMKTKGFCCLSTNFVIGDATMDKIGADSQKIYAACQIMQVTKVEMLVDPFARQEVEFTQQPTGLKGL